MYNKRHITNDLKTSYLALVNLQNSSNAIQMISRTVGLYPNRTQPTFPLLDSKGNSRAYQPNREKFKGSDPFSFLPYWGFVIGHKPLEKLKTERLWQRTRKS